MKFPVDIRLEKWRVNAIPALASPSGADFGWFHIPSPFAKSVLKVLSSGAENSETWEHVSIAIEDRCPTWQEMAFVKKLFWGDDETVVQFHSKKSEYVNCHEFRLHLWKRRGMEFELPPRDLI